MTSTSAGSSLHRSVAQLLADRPGHGGAGGRVAAAGAGPEVDQRRQADRHDNHASYANTSGQPRLSYAVHLQDGDNHYRPYRNAQGREIHIVDEKLCRKLPNGDPDFSDPDVFPTVWAERH